MPVDVSEFNFPALTKSSGSVYNERFVTHLHNFPCIELFAQPSIRDVLAFANGNFLKGKITDAIDVFDLGKGYGQFLGLVDKLHIEAVWRQAEGKPGLSKQELRRVRLAGQQAAEGFRISGRSLCSQQRTCLKCMKIK